MVYRVSELSPEQRLVIEGLLGRSLKDQESLTIRPVIRSAPTGEERRQLAQRLAAHMDSMADKAKDVPQAELENAFEEALRAGKRG
jgi:hypothetical protein